ncbi:hypothetical protein AB395_00004817 (plasmid) [Sinorhizobium fredii CCBAU 45436]|nr:hypothetical protein AB395_00004817 [Sinorhizobium fredii CCBAU 45436]
MISSTWGAPSPATRRASRATFPKIDSRGCLVEFVCNGRASLPPTLHAIENIRFRVIDPNAAISACAEIRTTRLARWAKTCTMPP